MSVIVLARIGARHNGCQALHARANDRIEKALSLGSGRQHGITPQRATHHESGTPRSHRDGELCGERLETAAAREQRPRHGGHVTDRAAGGEPVVFVGLTRWVDRKRQLQEVGIEAREASGRLEDDALRSLGSSRS